AQGDAKDAAVSAAPARSPASIKKELNKKDKPAIAVTPEREAAAITFVQRNHAELADLLASLKASQPQEYERAIRDIYRTTERLKAVDRVAKLDADISRFENDREKVIDQQVRLLLRAAADGKPAKLSPKNAAKAAKNRPTN